jgi:hypothetical protein
MQIDALSKWLQTYFTQHADELSLTRSPLEVRYILNLGGFVNASFEITDGRARYHLKITRDHDNLSKFQRWYAVHKLLEERYHAPRLIRWMDFPDLGFAGFLSEFIDGREPDFRTSPELLNEVIAAVDLLHSDQSLAALLPNPARTYRDSFIDTYIDRFTADLAVISPRRPAFISEQLVEWMRCSTGTTCRSAIRRSILSS